jgi:hypothetical protein
MEMDYLELMTVSAESSGSAAKAMMKSAPSIHSIMAVLTVFLIQKTEIRR